VNILFVTAMRNEAIHLTEWIAHHRAIGVSHFLIYTNDCDDGTNEILDRYAAEGIVTRVDTPKGEKTVQWRALKAASAHPKYKAADWAAFVDSDEFMAPMAPARGLEDILGRLDGIDGVALPWRLFGNSAIEHWDGGLTSARFVNAAPTDIALPAAWFCKSIIRPRAFGRLGVHRPQNLKDGQPVWINGAGQRLPEAFGANPKRINLFGLQTAAPLIQLNHYSLRSVEEFMLKRARGLPNRVTRELDLAYWVERNWNTVPDGSMAAHLPALRAEMASLRGIAGVALERAETTAREKIVAAMKEAGTPELMWRIALAGESKPPSPEQTNAHLKRLAARQT